MVNPFTLKIPTSTIKNYHGEKIGLYWKFLQVYTGFLYILAPLGLAVFIVQVIKEPEDDSQKVVGVVFCVITVIWATVFEEYWKRTQARLSVVWGTMDFEDDEVERPQFQGQERRSVINDNPNEIYFPRIQKILRMSIAFAICLIFCATVLVCMVSILIFKEHYEGKIKWGEQDISQHIGSALNAVQILIFNLIYAIVAEKSTFKENHKTMSTHEDSLITKTYIFQFINSFCSMFYLAFLKIELENDYDEEYFDEENCDSPDECIINELQLQLAYIYIIGFLKNIVELGTPWMLAKFKWRKQKKQQQNQQREQSYDMQNPSTILRREIEKEFMKPEYIFRGVDGTFADYLELAVQYGFVTLFSVAFPAALFLAAINNIAEMYVDRTKMLHIIQRPRPQGAATIGTWQKIIEITTVLAIFSNAGLICFTSPSFDDVPFFQDHKFMLFCAVLTILFIVREGVKIGIPDFPEEYLEIAKRHHFIVETQVMGFYPPKHSLEEAAENINQTVIGTIG